MNRNRLLALARKVLDESSPEPERITSGQMLARELIRELENVTTPGHDPEAQERAEYVNGIVKRAVARAEAQTDPESKPTWVDFDLPKKPPATVGASFDDNAFGRKPKRR